MDVGRREFLIGALALALGGRKVLGESSPGGGMYGLIGKMLAVPGQRSALIEILLESSAEMPGCLAYVIAADAMDPDAVWITEVWDSRESHAASLSLPAVQQAIARARPIIAGFGERFETIPAGGVGLRKATAS